MTGPPARQIARTGLDSPPGGEPIADAGSSRRVCRLARPVVRGRVAARQPRFRRDLLVTFATQMAVAVGGLLLYRLLAIEKGTAAVAAYALVKQVVVFAFPAAMLGLQVAVPRYVALSRDRAHAPEAYLLAAVLITGATLTVISLIAASAPGTVAILAFGDERRTSLVLPLVATLAATIEVELITGYFRGRFEFQLSALVRVVGVAALPVVLVLGWRHYSIERLINLMALGLGLLCAVTGGLPLLRAVLARTRRQAVEAGRLMLGYGYRRVPGDLAEIGLMSLPLVLAAHYAALVDVAFLAAGLQLLAVVRIALYPVGLVFLPTLTRMCGEDWERARDIVRQMVVCALHFAVFTTPQLLIFGGAAAAAWLGSGFAGAGTVIRLVVLPAGLYVFYIVLRSALDAAAVTAYNARNNIAALLVFGFAVAGFLGSGLFPPVTAIAGAFAVGVVSLGCLTVLTVHSVYRLDLHGYALPACGALSALAAAAAFGVQEGFVGSHPTLSSLGIVAAFELCAGSLYLFGLARAGVAWPGELFDRLRARDG